MAKVINDNQTKVEDKGLKCRIETAPRQRFLNAVDLSGRTGRWYAPPTYMRDIPTAKAVTAIPVSAEGQAGNAEALHLLRPESRKGDA